MFELVFYRDKICIKFIDFIWGDFIDYDVCDVLVDFYYNNDFFYKVDGRFYIGN